MIIVGGGVAGLMAALAAAPYPVTLINPLSLERQGAASWLSQGGMAAAVGNDDTVDLHIADTLSAGAGLCDNRVVKKIISTGPALVKKLLEYGVVFDRQADGTLALGLEAAHSRNRILHGNGDCTGANIMKALIAKIHQTPSVTIMQASVQRIFVDDRGVTGVQILKDGTSFNLNTDRVLLATGGIGGLYLHSTNPPSSIGHGLSMASSAGAFLRDLEFIQFHPTALNINASPLPLISEAVRGEGARFVDELGNYFMDGQDLAPRDVVARKVFNHCAQGHHVFLDTSRIADKFSERFPSINAFCIKAGYNPAIKPIPVTPAAHYHMGGVAVDEFGRTNIDGLYAAGEVACTGLHGANRLASNSLLEAAVCGEEAGRHMANQAHRHPVALPVLPLPPAPNVDAVRKIMSLHCGVIRTVRGLGNAADALSEMAKENSAASLALKIVEAALARPTSVGAHALTDQSTQQAA
ncbi:L-aspartate oxidase [Acidocella sp.]|uniref:L-aspartate oxidase n=1 Tax=Acidocella sp. TaxID=50710 RepID=UPI00262387D9|nr:L-aspartate oxidase [Acidocella sp.]